MSTTIQPGWRARARYRFDNTVARGSGALIAWLALVAGLLIVLAGIVLAATKIATEDGRVGFVEGFWLSLLRTLDPGTMGDDKGWPFRVLALSVTIGGIFIVSALIGLLSAALDQKIEELRKGRSPVLEKNHTLILGWSSKLFAVVSELIVANENQRRPCVVVMAEKDKVAMEDELRDRLGDTRGTRIVCRTGRPSSTVDLAMVRASEARAVVVLCPDEEGGDADVVRAVLALTQNGDLPRRVRLVAELTDSENAAALRLATSGLVTVVSGEIIARVTAQVCRYSGLSAVYQELLDFDGDEIYFQHEPALAGSTFADAMLSYDDSTVIGLRFADGRVALAPPMTTVIGPGDQVIAISRDDDTVVLRPEGRIAVEPGSPGGVHNGTRAEDILVLGWNPLAPRILHELDGFVRPGSSVHVVVDPSYVTPDGVDVEGKLQNLELSIAEGDTTVPEHLAQAMLERRIDHVIVLCYRQGLTQAEADARTLLTLLQIRHLLERHPDLADGVTVVSELLDVRDVDLARTSHADDFVVSERLTSLMLAQLAENLELNAVFDDLLSPGGAELYFYPARAYVPMGEHLTFATAIAAAQEFGEVAIGYRSLDSAGTLANGIVINPQKSRALTFAPDDQLIILRRPEPAMSNA